MSIGIKVDFLWFSIGTGDFFHSFFSTICVNLEGNKWGGKFPVIMKDLYAGELKVDKLEVAQLELAEIKKLLAQFPPSKIVWDVENLQKIPPWGDNISKDIKTLADYFVTDDGKNLIDVIDEALKEAISEQVDLIIESL